MPKITILDLKITTMGPPFLRRLCTSICIQIDKRKIIFMLSSNVKIIKDVTINTSKKIIPRVTPHSLRTAAPNT